MQPGRRPESIVFRGRESLDFHPPLDVSSCRLYVAVANAMSCHDAKYAMNRVDMHVWTLPSQAQHRGQSCSGCCG